MSAEELFLNKYGNKITASESWVIRFAEEYASIQLKDRDEEILELTQYIKDILQAVADGTDLHAEIRWDDEPISKFEALQRQCDELAKAADLLIQWYDDYELHANSNRDWETAYNELKKALSKYSPNGSLT